MHRLFCDLSQVQIFYCIFSFRVRADDKTEKDTPLLCCINHAVCLPSSHESITAKQRAGDRCSVLSWPVLNVSDRGLRASVFFCICGFDDCHYAFVWPPSSIHFSIASISSAS